MRTHEALGRRSNQLFDWVREGKLRVKIGGRYPRVTGGSDRQRTLFLRQRQKVQEVLPAIRKSVQGLSQTPPEPGLLIYYVMQTGIASTPEEAQRWIRENRRGTLIVQYNRTLQKILSNMQ